MDGHFFGDLAGSGGVISLGSEIVVEVLGFEKMLVKFRKMACKLRLKMVVGVSQKGVFAVRWVESDR